jgi:hypothetical protein
MELLRGITLQTRGVKLWEPSTSRVAYRYVLGSTFTLSINVTSPATPHLTPHPFPPAAELPRVACAIAKEPIRAHAPGPPPRNFYCQEPAHKQKATCTG